MATLLQEHPAWGGPGIEPRWTRSDKNEVGTAYSALSRVWFTVSKVRLALHARDRLAGEGLKARVVSLPCWSLFKVQPEPYRKDVLPEGVPLLAIEAGVTLGWHSYVGPPMSVLGADRYGASAPGEVVMREYGFTEENICRTVRDLFSPTQDGKETQ